MKKSFTIILCEIQDDLEIIKERILALDVKSEDSEDYIQSIAKLVDATYGLLNFVEEK